MRYLFFFIITTQVCFSQFTSGLGFSYSAEQNNYRAIAVDDNGYRKEAPFSVHNLGLTYDIVKSNPGLDFGPFISAGYSPCGTNAEHCRTPTSKIVLQLGAFVRFGLYDNKYFLSMEGYRLIESVPGISLTVLKPGVTYKAYSFIPGNLFLNLGASFTLYDIGDYFYEPMAEVSSQGVYFGVSYQWN